MVTTPVSAMKALGCLILLAVVVSCSAAVLGRGHRGIERHPDHRRGPRRNGIHFATRPSEEVGRRLRSYKRGVNKTRPFEAGIGTYLEFDLMVEDPVEANAILAGTYTYIRWPQAVVPYQIIGTFSTAELANIQWTIKHFAENTCVRFVPRTTEEFYISINNSATGCWSYVGRHLDNKYNLVNLQNPACMETGTVAHEFMHALGFYHEFTRPDRDDWVSIDQGALAPEYQTASFMNANFGKKSADQVELYGIPYAYGSVMHYSKWGGAVSYNRPVMNNLKPWPLKDFGNDTGLSLPDIKKINYMYCNSSTITTTRVATTTTKAPTTTTKAPITTTTTKATTTTTKAPVTTTKAPITTSTTTKATTTTTKAPVTTTKAPITTTTTKATTTTMKAPVTTTKAPITTTTTKATTSTTKAPVTTTKAPITTTTTKATTSTTKAPVTTTRASTTTTTTTKATTTATKAPVTTTKAPITTTTTKATTTTTKAPVTTSKAPITTTTTKAMTSTTKAPVTTTRASTTTITTTKATTTTTKAPVTTTKAPITTTTTKATTSTTKAPVTTTRASTTTTSTVKTTG
nr:uncharacterized protein PB18E9.04c-like [Aedes albopictus]